MSKTHALVFITWIFWFRTNLLLLYIYLWMHWLLFYTVSVIEKRSYRRFLEA